MAAEPSQEVIRKAAEQLGIKEGGEYRLVFTKELKIEPMAKTLDITAVLPYPLPEVESCEVCDKSFAQHGFTPYFTDPKHILSVRNFVIALMEKLDLTKNMPLKLAVEAPNTVLNPKEIVEGIFNLLKEEDVNRANHYIQAVTHYTPSESVRFALESGRGSLSQRIFQVERHYMALCREWRSEIQIHKHLTEQIGLQEAEKKGERFNEVEFAEQHEEEVETDYFNIQSDFHLVTARILAYEKMVKEYAKVGPYDIMRRSIEKRSRRLTYPTFPTFPSYGFPVRRRTTATRGIDEL